MTQYQSIAAYKKSFFIDLAAEVLIIVVLITAAIYPALDLEGGTFNIGSYSVSALTILMPIVATGGSVFLFINRSEIHIIVADLAVFAFMGYLLIRNSISPGAPAALKYAVYCLFIYFIVSMIIQNPPSLRRLMYAIVCISLVMAVYGIIEYAVQYNYLYKPAQKYVFESPGAVHRVSSSLGHPVVYGAFILQVTPFIIFSIFLWARCSGWRQVALGITAATGSIVALVLTFTKGSWLVAVIIVMSAADVLIQIKRKRGFLLALGIIILIALLILAFWSQILNELSWRSVSSVRVRVVSWTAAVEVIRENFIFGTGLRQGNQELWTKIQKDMYFENFYLAITSEGGIVALTLWLGMFVLLIKDGLKTIREQVSGSYLSLAALVSLLAISLNALTFDGMMNWTHFIFFWFAAGILRGSSSIHTSEIKPATPS